MDAVTVFVCILTLSSFVSVEGVKILVTTSYLNMYFFLQLLSLYIAITSHSEEIQLALSI